MNSLKEAMNTLENMVGAFFIPNNYVLVGSPFCGKSGLVPVFWGYLNLMVV
jgi:hypothetical protein